MTLFSSTPGGGRRSASRRLVMTGAAGALAALTLGWRENAKADEAAPAPASSDLYFPPTDGSWETVDPAGAGWHGGWLEAALTYAGRRNTTGIVILDHGRIIAERYWGGADAGTGRDVASVQKSVVSVLIGTALARRQLHIDDSVSDWVVSGWSAAGETEASITVRHLMAMSSGLDSSLSPVAAPGTTWYYNTAAFEVLHAVLEACTGSDLQTLSTRTLFNRIGMAGAAWQTRTVRGRSAAYTGLTLTPRDMARFGLLALARGNWAGTPVTPAVFLDRAWTGSQPTNPSYGLLWWLNGKEAYQLPGPDPVVTAGSLIPTAPADLVAALGRGDQKVYVVPSRGVVVIRQGAATAEGGITDSLSEFDAPLWDLLSRAMP